LWRTLARVSEGPRRVDERVDPVAPGIGPPVEHEGVLEPGGGIGLPREVDGGPIGHERELLIVGNDTVIDEQQCQRLDRSGVVRAGSGMAESRGQVPVAIICRANSFRQSRKNPSATPRRGRGQGCRMVPVVSAGGASWPFAGRRARLPARGAVFSAGVGNDRLVRESRASRGLPGAHQAGEARKQIMAVARPGRGLGVILHGEHRLALEGEPAIRSVEQ